MQDVSYMPPPMTDAPPLWRLVGRIFVDAIAFFPLTAIFLGVFAAVGAGLDWLVRGPDQFVGDFHAFEGLVHGETSGFLGLSADGALSFAFTAGVLLYLANALAVLSVARFRRGPQWRDYIAWRGFRIDTASVILAVVGIGWGIGMGSLIESWHPEAKNWVILPKGVYGVFISLFLVAILGPLCEELLFRGWLFTALRPRFGFVTTLLVTAALFAAAHWENTHLYALAVFPVGLVLGYLRERSDGIKTTFAFHGVYNLMGWIFATFASK